MPVLVTCMIEKIQSEMKALEYSQYFPDREFMGIFQDAHGQLTPQSKQGPNLELIQEFMIVLVTCKNEENLIKEEGARVIKTL